MLGVKIRDRSTASLARLSPLATLPLNMQRIACAYSAEDQSAKDRLYFFIFSDFNSAPSGKNSPIERPSVEVVFGKPDIDHDLPDFSDGIPVDIDHPEKIRQHACSNFNGKC